MYANTRLLRLYAIVFILCGLMRSSVKSEARWWLEEHCTNEAAVSRTTGTSLSHFKCIC